MTKNEMQTLCWNLCDFILVTGDAYVDHPSFGAAIISRLLTDEGFKVGIVSRPDPQSPKDFTILGKPKYAFLVTSGNIDSMVNLYTAAKKPRSQDVYSPGGRLKFFAEKCKTAQKSIHPRPSRSLITYASRIKQAYPGIPVILGGLEASLRRLSHYDYWSNKVRRSVLVDSKADLLVYGMGEKPIIEIAQLLSQGVKVENIRSVRGSCYKKKTESSTIYTRTPANEDIILLPPYGQSAIDPSIYAASFKIRYNQTNPYTAQTLVEQTIPWDVVQLPPALPLSQQEMDRMYDLPYTREAHPTYLEPIPALQEVKFSITASRGCYGNCSFCSLSFHQGAIIQTRSRKSLIKEAERITHLPDFKGYIHDVGGPTANFLTSPCKKHQTKGPCHNRECLTPHPCPQIEPDHQTFLENLRAIRTVKGVKKVFVRSGIRYDYLMADIKHREKSRRPEKKENEALSVLHELIRYHISGQLKVAPEHFSKSVLRVMNKPSIDSFLEFSALFKKINKSLGYKQFLIPYLISGHPGSTLKDAIELALFLKKYRFIPDQVQDFYPTPGTLSTCMYFTEINPLTGKSVYVPKEEQEKQMQRALLHFHKPENREMVKKALKQTGRLDLIGPQGLIKK